MLSFTAHNRQGDCSATTRPLLDPSSCPSLPIGNLVNSHANQASIGPSEPPKRAHSLRAGFNQQHSCCFRNQSTACPCLLQHTSFRWLFLAWSILVRIGFRESPKRVHSLSASAFQSAVFSLFSKSVYLPPFRSYNTHRSVTYS